MPVSKTMDVAGAMEPLRKAVLTVCTRSFATVSLLQTVCWPLMGGVLSMLAGTDTGAVCYEPCLLHDDLLFIFVCCLSLLSISPEACASP